MPDKNNLVSVKDHKAKIQQQANTQYALAREIVYRTYLNRLNDYPIIPFSETGIDKRGPATVGLLELTRIVYDARGNSLDNLLNVFASLGKNYGATLIVKSDGKCTHLYLGVRAYSQEYSASSGSKLLKQTLDGHFPGTDCRALKYPEINELLDCNAFIDKHPEWAISAAPGILDLKTEERDHFTQGLERFIDAMQGKEYTAVILAEPVDAEQLLNVQTGYEQMASALSVYQKLQMSMGINDSEAVSSTITEGFTHTISNSLTLSQSHSEGLSNTHSISDSHSHTSNAGGAVASGIGTVAGTIIGTMILPGFGTMVGAQIGGAVGGMAAGVMGSDTDSTSISDSTGTTTSDTYSNSEQKGSSDSTSSQKSVGTTKTLGSSQTISLEQQNKSISRLLDRIDQQLKRIDESRAFGTWNASCYILSPDTETASAGAAIYMGALRGVESGSEDSAIAVWKQSSKLQRQLALEYFGHLAHPRLRLGERVSTHAPIITPTSLITGKELALLMNLPRKSVGGVTILDGVGYGREKRILEIENEPQKGNSEHKIHLGRVRHLYRDQEQDVSLQLHNMVYHTLISGTTGTGKSTTIKSILVQCHQLDVPFLVIEPAKNEFAELSSLSTIDRPVTVLQAGRPGDDCLRLNPLIFPLSGTTTIIEHIDRVCALFNAAFPMYAAMPQILEEALIQAYERFGWDLLTSRTSAECPVFPTLRDVADLIPEVVHSAGYESETKSTYIGALTTRLRSLTRGALGLTFMASEETPAHVLFDQPCVVNLSSIGSPEKKAVLMGLLMVRLQEHRIQQGQTQHDQLKHLMVLEEAHHLLKKTSTTQSQESSNPQGQAVEFFANALAEMRAYGQGFIIADQSVSALDVAVLRNTNTKIVFRAPFEEDRQAISGALVLDEKQRDALARLESHTAIVKQNNWLEAIQCHIDVSKTRQKFMDQETKDLNTSQSDLVRQCRTMLLIALLNERFPEGVELPSLQCTSEDVKKWIKSLYIDEKASHHLLSTLIEQSPVENFEEIFPALWSIPPLFKTLQSAFQCSVSDRGIINHLVITIKELTYLTDKAVIAEVIHTLLRAYRTQDADRVADLLN